MVRRQEVDAPDRREAEPQIAGSSAPSSTGPLRDDAPYAAQTRGDAAAYARYLAGMDASMKQKVALTAAHLLGEGRVADMGSGSGAGSAALAALYPRLQVIGVDVSPAQVAEAAQRHCAPNLGFVVGDAAAAVFEPESLDGIFDSSMLHHVTSFNGYDKARVRAALEAQVAQLKPNGVLIVRDFVDPGPGEVLLDLRSDDGQPGEDPADCTSAALFRRFAREFRLLATDARRGFTYLEEASPRPGWARFRVARTLATELILRKDYRQDWALEAQEEYTYATQAELEALFAALGLRVLASVPIWNPWIVHHRYDGQVELRDATSGEREDYPPTNYLIVGEKVRAGQGVVFRSAPSSAAPGFLELSYYRDRETQRVLDLVRRPHDTLDVVPYFVHDGRAYVLARLGYPRSLLAVDAAAEPSLDGARAPHYVTEPIVVVRRDEPLAEKVEEALVQRAGLEAGQIRRFTRRSTYYPSPGGLAEEVRAIHVEIDPVFVDQPQAGSSETTTAGRIGAIEACQLLRAAQVGGLPDARLELNAYALLATLGLDRGPWIGEAIALVDGGPANAVDRSLGLDALLARPQRRRFERVGAEQSRGFLALSVVDVEELDARGAVVARTRREYVAPRTLSRHTVACAVLRRVDGQVWIGLQDHDLPAAQCFEGSSAILVAPAWRLPRTVSTRRGLEPWLAERMAAELRLTVVRSWELGGRYHPSAGATPEVVYPRLVEVAEAGTLSWVPLAELCAGIERITDGHLRIVALRAAHALGI